MHAGEKRRERAEVGEEAAGLVLDFPDRLRVEGFINFQGAFPARPLDDNLLHAGRIQRPFEQRSFGLPKKLFQGDPEMIGKEMGGPDEIIDLAVLFRAPDGFQNLFFGLQEPYDFFREIHNRDAKALIQEKGPFSAGEISPNSYLRKGTPPHFFLKRAIPSFTPKPK